jgi:hypothetical protein
MMPTVKSRPSSLALSLLIFTLLLPGYAEAAGPLLIAYGGHNETMAPQWVGVEKGGCSKSTGSIPGYYKPAADPS